MPSIEPRKEFATHQLNELGRGRAVEIAAVLTECLNDLEQLCGTDGREIAIVRSKLEEAGFYAKKSMAMRSENQE